MLLQELTKRQMQLNKAISKRLLGLLAVRNIMQYQLFTKSIVHKSTTMENVVNDAYTLFDFRSSLFYDENLEYKTKINM